MLSVCPEKCIFASATASIPICTTNEEGRILDCPVHSNISCLLSLTNLTPLQESEKLDIWSLSRAEWFKLCYLGIAQSGIGSWHVINTPNDILRGIVDLYITLPGERGQQRRVGEFN